MAGWWKRFVKWRREVAEQSGEPYLDVTPEKEQSVMAAQEEDGRQGGWLSKWRAPKRREQQLATLQQGFSELVDLTRSIRAHMDQQAATQKTLLDMMQQLPGAVEGLKSVGKASEQQTETLALLRKQLESAARNEDHMVESMRSFNKTLTLMDEMSQRTSQTVSSMADRTRDSEDMLRNILERSERRLVYTIVTLMVVTLTVLGVGLYVGFSGHTMTGVMIEPTPLPAVSETFEHKKSITDLADEVPEERLVADPLVPVEIDLEEAVEEEAVEDTPMVDESEPVDEGDVAPAEEPAEADDVEPVPEEYHEDVDEEEEPTTDEASDDALDAEAEEDVRPESD